MLDPIDGRCQIASDPRDSLAEHAARAGEQWTGKPYVYPSVTALPGCGCKPDALCMNVACPHRVRFTC